MEQHSRCGQERAWSAGFQRKYSRRLLAILRRRRIHQRVTRLSARSVALKFALDVSLAMTARGRNAWRRAILRSYPFRLQKTRWQRRVVNSRVNSLGKRMLVSVKARPCEHNADRDISGRQLAREESRITRAANLRSRDNFDEQSGGSVASRMQTLRAIVPGSRGLDTPLFLKEAADYIVALKMQVQAMQALADCYSNQNAHAACHTWV